MAGCRVSRPFRTTRQSLDTAGFLRLIPANPASFECDPGESAKNLTLSKKGALPIFTPTNETMHGDHVEWSSDCDMWRDDMRAWHHELVTARTIVGRLTKALTAHEELLRAHCGAIQLNEQLPDAHEFVLRQQEEGCSGRVIMPTDAQHGRESIKHDELKLAHGTSSKGITRLWLPGTDSCGVSMPKTDQNKVLVSLSDRAHLAGYNDSYKARNHDYMFIPHRTDSRAPADPGLGPLPEHCRHRTAIGADVAVGEQVLTRGPIHEAFAEPVVFNAKAGVIVAKTPPAAIEEIPPDQRPEGTNVAWIPGYWGWDDERNDFLWVSGIWRALPPGRQWIPGYWAASGQGSQWTSGYWGNATSSEVEYLPEPPATVEAGPNAPRLSPNDCWLPGTWLWQQSRYAWRPGVWATVQPDWVWIPAICSAPRGYVFVNGYWDYSVGRRGVLFAPVIFDAAVYRAAASSTRRPSSSIRAFSPINSSCGRAIAATTSATITPRAMWPLASTHHFRIRPAVAVMIRFCAELGASQRSRLGTRGSSDSFGPPRSSGRSAAAHVCGPEFTGCEGSEFSKQEFRGRHVARPTGQTSG